MVGMDANDSRKSGIIGEVKNTASGSDYLEQSSE